MVFQSFGTWCLIDWCMYTNLHAVILQKTGISIITSFENLIFHKIKLRNRKKNQKRVTYGEYTDCVTVEYCFTMWTERAGAMSWHMCHFYICLQYTASWRRHDLVKSDSVKHADNAHCRHNSGMRSRLSWYHAFWHLMYFLVLAVQVWLQCSWYK
jgi:hypothetical protein